MKTQTLLADAGDKENNQFSYLKESIAEKENNIKKYEEEIKNIKKIREIRSKEMDKFEDAIKTALNDITLNESQLDQSTAYASTVFNTQLVNTTLSQTIYERELNQIKERAEKINNDFNKFVIDVENTEKELYEVKEKRRRIEETLIANEESRSIMNTMNEKSDKIDASRRETNKLLIDLHQQMIDLIKRKIQAEIVIEKEVCDQFKHEMESCEEEDIDTFEYDLVKEAYNKKKQKMETLEKELKESKAKQEKTAKEIKKKQKELQNIRKNVEKERKRSDDVNNIVICPCYTVKLAQEIAETRSQKTRVIDKLDQLKLENRMKDDEVKEATKLKKLLNRKIGNEEERKLSFLAEINKMETNLIYLNADDEIEEATFASNAKEMDKIARKKCFLEEEFNQMFNYKLNVPKEESFVLYNEKELKTVKKELKKVNKDKVTIATKIELLNDDISHLALERSNLQAKLNKKYIRKLKNAKKISLSKIESKIEEKRAKIRQTKERIAKREERLIRVERINGIYDHKTPFVFEDIERVCDRTALRKKRVSDMQLKERKATKYVEQLRKFAEIIKDQANELETGNGFSCSKWIRKISECIESVKIVE